MRLTLRTLLAFRDGLLAAGDAQTIGAKIGASAFASKLLYRLDEVGDDCALADTSAALDANTLACYLDNSLPPDQVGALEKSFLESDALLAELAACHVVLSRVLDHPVRVEMARRERMYNLHRAPVTVPSEVATESYAVAESDLENDGAIPSDDDILNWMVADSTSNEPSYGFVTEGATDLSAGTAVMEAPAKVSSEPTSAAAAASMCAAVATRANHGVKQRRSESSTANSTRSWYPANWYSNLFGVAVARPVLTVSMLAAVFTATFCLSVFGGMSAPPPRAIKVAAHAYGLPEVDGEPCTRLTGKITCQVQQAGFADAGAIVIAWPVGVPKLAKFTTSRVFSELSAVPPKFTSMQLYVGQTNEQGDYLLRLKPGNEYFVLVLSSNARRNGDLTGQDREDLAARFDEPDSLIGSRGYQLARCKVVNGAIQHDCTFGKKVGE